MGVRPLQHGFYLIVDVLGRKAQLLVEHLVRSRETEGFQTPDFAVGTNQTLQVDGQTGCQTKYFGSGRQDVLLIAGHLATEQTFGRNGNDTYLDTVLAQQLGTCYECRYFRA